MKYHNNIRGLASLALCLLLSACSTVKYDFINLASLEQTEFKQVSIDNFAVNKQIYSIVVPDKGNIQELIINNNIVYYVVDYAHNFVDQTGMRLMPKFTVEYQTEIRSYNLLTHEDTLVYKPSAANYRAIEHLGANDKYLFFVDYAQSNITHNADHLFWHLQLLHLQTKQRTEILPDLAGKYGEHRLFAKLSKQQLQLNIEPINSPDLHLKYDLVTGKTEKVIVEPNQYTYEDKIKLNYQVKGISKITDSNNINYLVDTSELDFSYQNKKHKQVALPLKVEIVKANEIYCLCQAKDKSDTEVFVLEHQNMRLQRLLSTQEQGHFHNLYLQAHYLLARCQTDLFLYDLEKQHVAKINLDVEPAIIHKAANQSYYWWKQVNNSVYLQMLSID